ncbi:MAG TPA: FAD-linked oxidase C-terminal domain-containing protein [Oscillatoriaceae cyanobacterium]
MTPEELATGLAALLPADAILTRPEQLLVYDCDAYTIEKALPLAVVLPRTTEEVAAVARYAHARGLPLVPRGAGTGLSGGALALEGGIIVALTRMKHVLEIDAPNRRALVEAGCVNLKLTEAAAPYGLMFAPDPSSQSACTIGGNVAENSGGPHTLKYGVTVNHVLGLEVVLRDGTVVWLGGPNEDTPGYDLTGLMVGSEGTFGIVTRAWVRLVPPPQAVRTMLAVFPTIETASQAVSAIIGAGLIPAALELMDRAILQAVERAFKFGFPLDAGAVLIIELDGLEAGIDALKDQVIALCETHGAHEVRVARDAKQRAELWKARKRAVGAVGLLAPSKITMDGVIPRTRLPEVLAAIADVGARHDLRIANVFHAGDGNLHPVILFDERDPEQVARVLLAGGAILDVCLAAGGSITGEHGVGVEKNAYMGRMFSAEDLALMQELRAVFNPDGRLNPGKLLPSGKGCVEIRVRTRGGAAC